MKRTQKTKTAVCAAQLRSGRCRPFGLSDGFVPMGEGEYGLYESIREAVPLLDAAIQKLVRMSGGVSVCCPDKQAETKLNRFLQTVPCGRGQFGIQSFLNAYLDSLLLYGRAVGEMLVSDGHLTAVCWGDVRRIHVQEGESPTEFALCVCENGEMKVLPYQNLLLFSTLHPEVAHPYGVSMFRSMPFLTDILLKIYESIGVNWERAGNVRYAVIYKPGESDAARAGASECVQEIASAWSQAMQEAKSGAVRDFIAAGDVEIRAIGADGKALDSEVPVRQIMEQLVAKTGLPPFLLGLSWSSTERMSAQQADLLTTELWALRRCVEPVLRRICDLWLRLEGYGCEAQIVWDEISLQDLVDEAHAALYRAQAQALDRQ